MTCALCSVLSKTGNGDGFYSSLFQATLEGNKIQNATVAADVSVKLKWYHSLSLDIGFRIGMASVQMLSSCILS